MIEMIDKYWLYFLIGSYPNGPIGGLAMTIIMAVVVLVVAFPVAILLGMARTSGVRVLSEPVRLFVSLIRGLPLIMFVFWVYFAVPMATGVVLAGVTTMILALIIYEAAYLSEIVRAGIEAIPKGQIEAASALGINYRIRMLRIVLPQALFNMLPSLVSQFGSIIKETSVGYVIAAQELTFAIAQANNIEATKPLPLFAIMAIVFYLLCGGVNLAAKAFERRIIAKRTFNSAMQLREA